MNRFGTKRAAVMMAWFKDPITKVRSLLLTKRRRACKTFPGWYAAVGGKIDAGECAIQAVQREMVEETGFYILREELSLIDCYVEADFKCFIFETEIGQYRFNDIKNREPKKHSPWKLYTIHEALKLPKLMPALREILLVR